MEEVWNDERSRELVLHALKITTSMSFDQKRAEESPFVWKFVSHREMSGGNWGKV